MVRDKSRCLGKSPGVWGWVQMFGRVQVYTARHSSKTHLSSCAASSQLPLPVFKRPQSVTTDARAGWNCPRHCPSAFSACLYNTSASSNLLHSRSNDEKGKTIPPQVNINSNILHSAAVRHALCLCHRHSQNMFRHNKIVPNTNEPFPCLACTQNKSAGGAFEDESLQ